MAVTFAYTGSSPANVGDSDAARVRWWLGLTEVAGSVGENIPVDGVDGTVGRDRVRGELSVELTWEVRGDEDLAGTPSSDRYQQMRRNWALLQRWFDDAPGREVTATVVDGWTLSGTVHHEEWAPPDWHGLFVRVRQLVTVSDGLLDEVVP